MRVPGVSIRKALFRLAVQTVKDVRRAGAHGERPRRDPGAPRDPTLRPLFPPDFPYRPQSIANRSNRTMTTRRRCIRLAKGATKMDFQRSPTAAPQVWED